MYLKVHVKTTPAYEERWYHEKRFEEINPELDDENFFHIEAQYTYYISSFFQPAPLLSLYWILNVSIYFS